jgi:hypothetical protein
VLSCPPPRFASGDVGAGESKNRGVYELGCCISVNVVFRDGLLIILFKGLRPPVFLRKQEGGRGRRWSKPARPKDVGGQEFFKEGEFIGFLSCF